MSIAISYLLQSETAENAFGEGAGLVGTMLKAAIEPVAAIGVILAPMNVEEH